MMLKLATWNINSVRLRIDLVTRFLREWEPDILCLQETKCPQGQFPRGPVKDIGYSYVAEFGQKGYHGVAVVSRLPLTSQRSKSFCGKDDSRHVSVTIETPKKLIIHNLYVPAGGDEPNPDVNEKFAHKLQFLDELEQWFATGAVPIGHEGLVVGDLNIAPLEHDVWSHKELLKVVSHTPIETRGLNRVQQSGQWVDVMRQHVLPHEKLYTWWSYRARDWAESNRGRRLDHVWATPSLANSCASIKVVAETRGWAKPSDHVPVIAEFDL